MKNVFIIMFICSVFYSCKAQKSTLLKIKKGKPFTTQGYLIHIYGQYGVWIFQPCNDSNIAVLDGNSNQSFFVQDMVNDLGYTFLSDARGIGKTKLVSVYDHTYKRHVEDTMQYLYCNVTINPVDSFYKLNDCAYTIKYDNIQKDVACWSLENFVTNIEPLDPLDRKEYLKKIIDNNFEVPDWAK